MHKYRRLFSVDRIDRIDNNHNKDSDFLNILL